MAGKTIINLTSKGRKAYIEHDKYHKKIDKLILQLLKNYDISIKNSKQYLEKLKGVLD